MGLLDMLCVLDWITPLFAETRRGTHTDFKVSVSDAGLALALIPYKNSQFFDGYCNFQVADEKADEAKRLLYHNGILFWTDK